MEDNYPGPRIFSEAERLRFQHELVTDAIGGLVPGGFDTARKNLRILDSGTADGYWLYAFQKQLSHPETAQLIGTDIAKFPDDQRTFPVSDKMTFSQQDVRAPWPEEWNGSFDLVHMRAVMASTGTKANAIAAVRRLTELVKPGGQIVLVDAAMAPGEIQETDKPSEKIFKAGGTFLKSFGLDTTIGGSVADVLNSAIEENKGEWSQVSAKPGTIKLGKGAKSSLEETGYAWIRGFKETLGGAMKKQGSASSLKPESIDPTFREMMEEAHTVGIEMEWNAAWAQKK